MDFGTRPAMFAGSGAIARREGIQMDFRSLNEVERRQLVTALRGNAEGSRVLILDRRDTRFAGTTDEVPEEEVIHAIKSIPCHY